ncbi:MAG: YybH family protein [Gemmatimonadota bacterium]
MLKVTRPMMLLTAIGLLAACQTEPAEQTGATEEAATADAATVRSEIESINDRFEQALLAHDAAAIAAIYTEDALVLPPSAPRTEGRAAIEAMFSSWFEQVPASDTFTLTTDQIVLAESGEIAYEIGTYQTSGTAPSGETYEESGKYLGVWENVGGEWKMAADMWSGDAPMSMEGEAGS